MSFDCDEKNDEIATFNCNEHVIKFIKNRSIHKKTIIKTDKAMKRKMMQLLSMLCILSVLFVGCSKDDDVIIDKDDDTNIDQGTPTTNGFFQIDEVKYGLSDGIIVTYKSKEHESYNTKLSLLSSELSKKQKNGDWLLSGKGSSIELDMFSSSPNKLDDGEYVYYDSEPPYPAKTFRYGEYLINLDADNHKKPEAYGAVSGGKITVSKVGNIYNITFNLTSNHGKKITGSYEGVVQYMGTSQL